MYMYARTRRLVELSVINGLESWLNKQWVTSSTDTHACMHACVCESHGITLLKWYSVHKTPLRYMCSTCKNKVSIMQYVALCELKTANQVNCVPL